MCDVFRFIDVIRVLVEVVVFLKIRRLLVRYMGILWERRHVARQRHRLYVFIYILRYSDCSWSLMSRVSSSSISFGAS